MNATPCVERSTATEVFFHRWAPLVVFGLGLLLLTPSIWSESSVTGGDEYSIAMRVPMEMRERGEWLTPWRDGAPAFEKPPLLYWAIRSTYELLGVNVFAARVWGVLAGSSLALSACLLARELFGRSGLLAGLLALASLGVAIEGRRAMLDVPVAVMSTFAVLGFIRWARRERLLDLVLAGGFLGLGFLIKGPVAFFFFFAGGAAWLVVFGVRAASPKRWWHLAIGLAVLAVVALPWPLIMHLRWGPQMESIMRAELAARGFGTLRAASPLAALGGALGLVFPWTLLVVAAVGTYLRTRRVEDRRAWLWLILWFTLSTLPFFFMKSFSRYMLAVVPAQIVLVAEWIRRSPTPWSRGLVAVSVGLLGVVGLAVSAFCWWFRVGTWEPFLLAAVAGAVMFSAFRQTDPRWLALQVAALFTCVLGVAYPRLGIAALPTVLPAELAKYRACHFDFVLPCQPALLSARLGYSVQSFQGNAWKDPTHPPEVVFLEDKDLEAFRIAVADSGLTARELGRFGMFFSRKTWVRFARADATGEDWREAFQTRSLERLKSPFLIFLVSPAPPAA